MKPTIVFDVRYMLERNDEADYKEDILRTANALGQFLEQNGLLKRKVLNTRGKVSKNEIITEDDLTEDGLALSWGLYIRKWLGAQDRGTKIENVKRLEKGLAEIRKVGAREFLKSTRYYIYHTDKKPD
ncbi:MAG: hypothetical protein JW395_0061 [Nitrospira sp.]|nr:hypothetical protein [Nitrospira sp.]